ncbi:TetR family transcriptional regulator [Amycolatopsis regifaucium]|uniref:TetR family transcriptional regulator n=1 Tax=Amycolatopsis regifaucium TaxID=546365 RepID=A0A154M517_9PSEU|nr:TetR family transcriptional regulator [Amycolatopsis regifaucium]KZB79708.1 TetR family transcriptional regulator [Amycolatopsis regifaucium]OKA09977.1 TetR family transcriptional regulator [Amycolatopsis regifaucium]SFI66528.1 DNA-binding transcriptional regulator, AcrR family [Amycolatopsis regifaucium]
MTDSSRRTPVARVGATPAGRRRLRRSLASAAVDLFVAHGYEATTIDEIAAAAGIGRRTFFRYFDAKDDVLFANHDEIVAEMEEAFAAADPSRDPVEVACAAVSLVLDSYAADLDGSLKRFTLTRTVPSLRDKEVATVDRYQRVLARYLQRRFEEQGDTMAALRAAVAAAAIAAANNHVLRRWLRSGGEEDIEAGAAEAFALVIDAFRTTHPSAGGRAGTVVAVMSSSAPLPEVIAQVSAALRRGDGTTAHPI